MHLIHLGRLRTKSTLVFSGCHEHTQQQPALAAACKLSLPAGLTDGRHALSLFMHEVAPPIPTEAQRCAIAEAQELVLELRVKKDDGK